MSRYNINYYAARSGRVIKEDGTYVNVADGLNEDGSQNARIIYGSDGQPLSESNPLPVQLKGSNAIETRTPKIITRVAQNTVVLNPNEEIVFAETDKKCTIWGLALSWEHDSPSFGTFRLDLGGSRYEMIHTDGTWSGSSSSRNRLTPSRLNRDALFELISNAEGDRWGRILYPIKVNGFRLRGVNSQGEEGSTSRLAFTVIWEEEDS